MTDIGTIAEKPPTAKADSPAVTVADPQWDKLIDLSIQNIERGRKTEERLGDISKRFGDLSSGIANRKIPEPPPPPKLTEPPTPEITSPFQAFGSPASALAIFGSMLTRTPLTTALNAGAKAITAIRQGDLQNYKLGYEAWETQTAYAIKVAKLENDRYQTILGNQQYSDDQKLNLLKAEAALLKDANMQRMAETGDIRAVSDMIYRRDLLRQNSENAALKAKPELIAFNAAIEQKRIELGREPNAAETLDIWRQVQNRGGKDRVTSAWETYKANNPQATWAEFEKKIPEILGTLTPDLRRELEAAKAEHAKERAIIISGGSGAPGVPKEVAKEAAKNIKPAVSMIQELDAGIDGVMKNPGAIGFRGKAIDTLGGVIQQLEDMTQTRGAVSSQLNIDAVRQVRASLENVVGKLIPTITGDHSGRYSDRDMQFVNSVFRALQGSASPEQALISLSMIRDIALRGLMKDVQLAGPSGKATLDAMGIKEEDLQKNRYAELMGKNGEYEYESVWMDGGQLWAKKSDGTVGRLKWRSTSSQ